MYSDPMHLARLAQLEGALCALLREVYEAALLSEPTAAPDSISATLTHDGLEIEYRCCGTPVGGEGL